jgi:hypothetical protein
MRRHLGDKHNSNGEPWQVLPPDRRRRKLFSEALRGGKSKSHRITVQSKDIDQSTEQLKLQLKKDRPYKHKSRNKDIQSTEGRKNCNRNKQRRGD